MNVEKIYRRLFIFSALVLMGIIHPENGKGQDCKKILLDYIQKSKTYYAKPDSVKVYCIEMITEVVFTAESGNKSTSNDTKMYFQGDKMFYQSGYVSMYMDKENTFTIIHPQRTIVWNKGNMKADKIREMTANAVQDTLFKYSTVASCKDSKDPSGKTLKEIILTPYKSSKILSTVQSVVYYYDMKEDRLYRSEIYYKGKSQKLRESTTYKMVDYNYKKKSLQASAMSEVFDSKGRLLTIWKGYELLDQRTAKQ